jgi:HEAT repeat protein
MIKVLLSTCGCLLFSVGCEQAVNPAKEKTSAVHALDRDRLLAQLRDKNAGVRLRAVNTLAGMHQLPDGILPSFLNLVRDPDDDVRICIAGVLGRFEASDVLDALIGRILDDSNPHVRKAAMRSIRRIGPQAKRSIPALIRVMQDEKSYSAWTKFDDSTMSTDCIICHAARALVEIGADSVPSLQGIIEDVKCNKVVREVAIQSLSRLGSRAERALPTLCKSVTDNDKGICIEAVIALVSIGPKSIEAKRALLGAFVDDSIHVRIIAAYALYEIDPANVISVPVLVECLTDKDWENQERAAIRLGLMGRKSINAVSQLTWLVRSPSQSVRWSAARALGRIGPGARDALPVLEKALGDVDGQVREAAKEALEAIRGKGA